MAKSISEQMQEILKEVEGDVNGAIDKSLKVIGKETRDKLKEVSPKDHGDYAKGWTYKRTDEKGVTVYNSKYPGLTHLLSKGHAIVNQHGKYGRLNGDNHIGQVETEYNQKIEQEVIKELSKD